MILPQVLNCIGACRKSALKEYGIQLSYIGSIMKNDKRLVFLGETSETEKLGKKILKRIVNENDFISKIFKRFNKRGQELIEFTRNNLTLENLKNKTNQELYSLLLKYYQKYERFGGLVAPIMFFAVNYLEEKVKKEVLPAHAFLLQSPYFSYVTHMELDYFKFCKKPAEKMYEKWGWIPFDYLGPEEWDTNHFLKKMGVDSKRAEQIISEHCKLIKKQEKILKQYPKQIIRLLDDLHLISKMQDDRKGVTTLTHPYLQKYLFGEISKRGVKWD